LRYAAALVAVAGLAGCGDEGSAQSGAAGAAASRFLAAESSDPGLACDLLAPKTRESVEQDGSCEKTIGEDAPSTGTSSPRSVEVYGKDAMARFDGDTVFLALFPEGWRVTAAHCKDAGKGRPFDCMVEGK
jgi:hypothetical protein